MSHAPPGLICTPDGFQITVGIKNYGITPAQVTGLVLKLDIQPSGHLLPENPDYSASQVSIVTGAFLVTDDEIFHSSIIKTDEPAIRIIGDKTRTIWV
jgi:hypothetical protein